jgi:hypothetical protein
MKSPDDLLRPFEVSREYHIGLTRLYCMMRANEIGYVPIGVRRKLIPRREVAAWIARTTVKPSVSS